MSVQPLEGKRTHEYLCACSAHTHTHTHTDTHTHLYAETYVVVYSLIHTHMHTHAHTCLYVQDVCARIQWSHDAIHSCVCFVGSVPATHPGFSTHVHVYSHLTKWWIPTLGHIHARMNTCMLAMHAAGSIALTTVITHARTVSMHA